MDHADHDASTAAQPDLGLTHAEAAERLVRQGPNEIPQPVTHRVRALAAKFWAPVPWLLEAAVVLELVLGNALQGGIFAVLLIVNAVLAFTQESRSAAAVDLLRARLQVQARVDRDGTWSTVAARELVEGDLVRLRAGDFVPADVVLAGGELEVDQAALTGESLPVRVSGPEHAGVAGGQAWSGSVVRRGEADATVTATGARTRFARTAELVGTTHAPGHLETLILGIVRWLVIIDLGLAAVVVVYGAATHLGWRDLLPFVLILVVASVPVALPATFTLATAIGSRRLARTGVLVTRLAAIEEAAAMSTLCADKTGTLTQNTLTVSAVLARPGQQQAQVLAAAVAASDAATQDPLDLAVLEHAREVGDRAVDERCSGRRLRYLPFDPSTKRSEAVVAGSAGPYRAAKGAPAVLAELVGLPYQEVAEQVEELSGTGARVLGVAGGLDGAALTLLGFVALADPPRPDSADLVAHLKNLGVRTVMVTGDGLATAQAIAAQVGVGGRAARAEVLRDEQVPNGSMSPNATVTEYDVFAEVLPEDKLALVTRLQAGGEVVGMTGDGVNDAPALRRAEVGIAVSSATDVAKAAASLVLTTSGLENVVRGVTESRRIHQRMLTYTLNKIVKTIQVAVFLSLGLLVTGQFVTTPTLVVLLLLANDFVTMSIATDRVSTPPQPQRWTVPGLVRAATVLAGLLVVLSFAVWWIGAGIGLDLAARQTLVFVWLVFSGQATVYLVREHRHFWHSMPSRWLLGSTVADLVLVGLLAWRGWLMMPVGLAALVVAVGTSVVYLVLGEVLKNTRAWRPVG
ncbi:MAG: plasma-membrane proton-efflux P-type ATPase [Actinomycetes bacterium]